MPTALGTIASGYKATTSPIPATGLAGWWDANDASTFSYSSGSVVSQWRDKSGNNRHANTVGGSPTVMPGSMNARPTLYLTGWPCHMEIAAFASAFTTAELFAVFKVKALGGSGSRSHLLSQWGTNNEVGWYPFSPSVLYENWGTAERPQVGNFSGNAILLAPHIYNVRLAPGSLTALINGVTIGSPSATVAFRSSGPYLIGNTYQSEMPDGYIAEVVMYNRVLSTVERQQVESYLHAKWIDQTGGQIPATGLAGWWDAADAASITASAGAVSQWNDKSGNARHVVQTVEANKPTTGTRTINGKNALDFTDDLLTVTTTITHPWVAFLVVKTDVGPSAATMNAISGVGNSAFISSQSGDGQWYVQGNGYMYFNRFRDTNSHLMSVVSDSNGFTSFYDGVQTATQSTGNTWGWFSVNVGAHGPGDRPFDGLIADIIVYDRVLSTVERQQVEQYLYWKWMQPAAPIPTTGLVGWWDAADAATISATGGKVSQWNDKSGLNRHVTQATGASQPSTGTRTMNGKNVLAFGPSSLQSAPFTLSQPLTAFAVVQSDISDTFGRHYVGYNSSPVMNIQSGKWVIYAGSTLTSTVSHDLIPHVASAVFNSTTSQQWVDGTQVISGDAGTRAFEQGIILGNQAVAGTEWYGAIAEVVIYNRVLSTVERQQVESYLKTKWGTP